MKNVVLLIVIADMDLASEGEASAIREREGRLRSSGS